MVIFPNYSNDNENQSKDKNLNELIQTSDENLRAQSTTLTDDIIDYPPFHFTPCVTRSVFFDDLPFAPTPEAFDDSKLQMLSNDVDSHAFTLAKLALESNIKSHQLDKPISSLEDLKPLLPKIQFNNLAYCLNTILKTLNNESEHKDISERFLDFSTTLSSIVYPKLSVKRQEQLLSVDKPNDFLLNIKFSKSLISPLLSSKFCYLALDFTNTPSHAYGNGLGNSHGLDKDSAIVQGHCRALIAISKGHGHDHSSSSPDLALEQHDAMENDHAYGHEHEHGYENAHERESAQGHDHGHDIGDVQSALGRTVNSYRYFGNEYFDLYYFESFCAEDLQSLDSSYVLIGDNLVPHGTLFKYHKILDLSELELVLDPQFLCSESFSGPFNSPISNVVNNIAKNLPTHLGSCASSLIGKQALEISNGVCDDFGKAQGQELLDEEDHVSAGQSLGAGQDLSAVQSFETVQGFGDGLSLQVLEALGAKVDRLPLRLAYDLYYIALTDNGSYSLDVDNEQLKSLHKLAFASLKCLMPSAVSELITHYQSGSFNLELSYSSIAKLWAETKADYKISPIIAYLDNHLNMTAYGLEISGLNEIQEDESHEQILSLEDRDLLVERVTKKIQNSLIILNDEDYLVALSRLFNIIHISEHGSNSKVAIDHDISVDAFNCDCIDFNLVMQKGSGNYALDYLMAAYAYSYKSNFLWVFKRVVGSLIAHDCLQSLFFAPQFTLGNFACPALSMQNRIKESFNSDHYDNGCTVVGTLKAVARQAHSLMALPNNALLKLAHNLILVGYDEAQLRNNYELMSLGSAISVHQLKPFIDKNQFKADGFDQYQYVFNRDSSNELLEFCKSLNLDLNYPQEQDFIGETRLIVHRNNRNGIEISYLQSNYDLFNLALCYNKALTLKGLTTAFSFDLHMVQTDYAVTQTDKLDLLWRNYYRYDKLVPYYASQLKLLHNILANDFNKSDESGNLKALYILPVDQDVAKVRAIINALEDFNAFNHVLNVVSISSLISNKHTIYQEFSDWGCGKCLIVVDNLLAKDLTSLIDIFKCELLKLKDKLIANIQSSTYGQNWDFSDSPSYDSELSASQNELNCYSVEHEFSALLAQSCVPGSILSDSTNSCATLLTLYEQGINYLYLKHHDDTYLKHHSSIFTCLLTGLMCIIQEQINALKSSPLALIGMNHTANHELNSLALYCIDPSLSFYNDDENNLFSALDSLHNFELVKLPLFNSEQELTHYHSVAKKFIDQYEIANKDAIDILKGIEADVNNDEIVGKVQSSDATNTGSSSVSDIKTPTDKHLEPITHPISKKESKTKSIFDLLKDMIHHKPDNDKDSVVDQDAFDEAKADDKASEIADKFKDLLEKEVTAEYKDSETVSDIKSILEKEIISNTIDNARDNILHDLTLDKEDPKYQQAINFALDAMSKNLINGNEWRDYQKTALPHILCQEQDCIISIPTGGGKSVLFQGPALFRAIYSKKLSIVISPLKALILEQVITLREKGFKNVDFLSSDRVQSENDKCIQDVDSGNINLLYVTPERFRSRPFFLLLKSRLINDGGAEYFIFDEAHCISQWGKTFRPDYIYAAQQCTYLKNTYGGSFIMCSATMTKQVVNDIKQYLNNPIMLANDSNRYSPIPDHISMSVCDIENTNNQFREEDIYEFIDKANIDFTKSRMIIFCPTRKMCEQLSESLNNRAIAKANSLFDDILTKLNDQISSYLELKKAISSVESDSSRQNLSMSERFFVKLFKQISALIERTQANAHTYAKLTNQARKISDSDKASLVNEIFSIFDCKLDCSDLIEKDPSQANNQALSTLTKLVRVYNEVATIVQGNNAVKISEHSLATLANHVSYFHAGLSAKERKNRFERFKANSDDPQNTDNNELSDAHDYQKHTLNKSLYSVDDSKELAQREDDEDNDDDFRDDDSKTQNYQIYILCSTNAFGMGLDIPNIHYVLHYSPPNLFENYLQEVGRAGRSYASYQEAFPDNRPLPAVCFFEKQDIEKILENTNNNMISWNALVLAEKTIHAYIKEFKSLEKAMISPTVVPIEVISRSLDNVLAPTFWSNNDQTKFRLMFYYLEHFKRIKMEFRQHLPVSLTITKENLVKFLDLKLKYLNGDISERERERAKVTIALVKYLIDCVSIYEAHKSVKNSDKQDDSSSVGAQILKDTHLHPVETDNKQNLFLFSVKEYASEYKTYMSSVFNILIELNACQALQFNSVFVFCFDKDAFDEITFFKEKFLKEKSLKETFFLKPSLSFNDAAITKGLPTLGVTLAVVRELLDEAHNHYLYVTNKCDDQANTPIEYYFSRKKLVKTLKKHLIGIKPDCQTIVKNNGQILCMPWVHTSSKSFEYNKASKYIDRLVPKIIRVLYIVTDSLSIGNFSFNTAVDRNVELESSDDFTLLATNQSYHLLLDVLAQDAINLIKYLIDREKTLGQMNFDTSQNSNADDNGTPIISDQYVFNWVDLIAELDLIHNDPNKLLNNYDLEQSRNNFDELYAQCRSCFVPYQYFNVLLSVLSHLKLTLNTPTWSMGYEVLLRANAMEPLDAAIQESSPFYHLRKELELVDKINRARALSVKVFFTCLKDSDRKVFIEDFFKIENYNGYVDLLSSYSQSIDDSIMSELTSEALTVQEEKFKDNSEQKAIYEEPLDYQNINVISGPGSGKTFILTMKVARLIIHDHVPPQNILVLAYNRAVVTELKTRLNQLFISLGLGRIGHRIYIFTFHGLAKFCLRGALNDIETSQWEYALLDSLKRNPQEYLSKFKKLEFILIDEFQDITFTRLNFLLLFRAFRPKIHFFTIGDINQSIYGFDRVNNNIDEDFIEFVNSLSEPNKEGSQDNTTYVSNSFNTRQASSFTEQHYAALLSPRPYYAYLNKLLKPKTMHLSQNYRSYQAILDQSAKFLDNCELLPFSNKNLQLFTTTNTVQEFDASDLNGQLNNIFSLARSSLKEATEAQQTEPKNEQEKFHLDKAKRNVINTIAFLYRTNNDVYKAFASLDTLNLDGFDVHIQGSSTCEPYRKREFFAVYRFFFQSADRICINSNKKNFYGNKVKAFCLNAMKQYPKWDSKLLDIAYCMVLNFIEERRSQSNSDSAYISELKEYYYDILRNDDSLQLMKIYDSYQAHHLTPSKSLKLVLSTMHKVKGLEFDMVAVMPSSASLPLIPHNKGSQELQEANNLADVQEERRLYYVAYTRARKYLFTFKGPRERALENNSFYFIAKDSMPSFVDNDPRLDHYNIGFSALANNFSINGFIERDVAINDEAEIIYTPKGDKYLIVHKNTQYIIGCLSKKHPIVKDMQRAKVQYLTGLFISAIVAWTYDDTRRVDQKLESENPYSRSTRYADLWCEAAKQTGFIYFVMLAGYGQLPTT